VLVRKWKAHFKSVNFLNSIDDPKGLISCGHDRHVKLWSKEGYLWGDIYLIRE